MSKLADISQEIACILDANGEPRKPHTAADVRELLVEGGQQFRQSTIGQQLLARSGQLTVQQLAALVPEEFRDQIKNIWDVVEAHVSLRLGENGNWANMGFWETMTDVGKDLLTAMPLPKVQAAPVTPKPTPKPPTAEELAAQEAQRKHENSLKHLAEQINRITREDYRQLLPKGGIVTLVHKNGYVQEFSKKAFDEAYQECVNLGLVTSGGIQ